MKARNNKSTLKRLSRDILSQRYLFALATVGTIIQVALTVYLPILIGDAVDAVLKMNAVLLMSRLIWQMLVVILANSAIQWLKDHGVTRLLTRAGTPETDLESRLKSYAELVGLAEGQLEILAGGGISVANRDQFLAIPGLEQVHGTRIVF